ncbi:MAG: VOC family protein [Candidatus Acidiferrales bacterium]|jgi:predicted enzyme related to lactoylglutathione lyase
MAKFDHMMLPVADCDATCDWYVKNLGFKVEFEIAKARTVAIQDDAGFTIFLQETRKPIAGERCALTMQVKDVDEVYRALSEKGVKFIHAPQKLFWGYGAELADPDGYLVRLWDEVSMREKGSA